VSAGAVTLPVHAAMAAVAMVAAGSDGIAHAQAGGDLVRYEVIGDSIPRPLTGSAGDPERGRAIVTNRQVGLCLLCHSGPFTEERFQGTLAPNLAGTGSRWSEGQLRLRVVDSKHLNPATTMPSFYRTEGLTRVGSTWKAQPVLSAQQVEDVVALLRTLRD